MGPIRGTQTKTGVHYGSAQMVEGVSPVPGSNPSGTFPYLNSSPINPAGRRLRLLIAIGASESEAIFRHIGTMRGQAGYCDDSAGSRLTIGTLLERFWNTTDWRSGAKMNPLRNASF